MQDEYGAGTGINETDKDGFGIRVTARYFMHIHDTSKGQSLQREQQLNIQQPLQYFFAFDYKRTIKQQIANKKDKKLYEFSKELGKDLTDKSSYRLFPLGKNEILVRFENLADAFDVVNTASLAQLDLSQSVNLTAFAHELYMEVNGNAARKVEIVETDLQGVHSLHKNFKWKAIEKGEGSLAQSLKQQVKSPPADSKDFSKVYIGPQ